MRSAKLIDEGRAVGSKELKEYLEYLEYLEVIGYGAVAKWVYGRALEPRDCTAGKPREDSDVAFAGRLAKVHNDFERIHPYLDGNGRAGRLLLNLLLVRLGYPPAIVVKNERTKYVEAMRTVDEGDYGPMGELIARAVTNSLHSFVVAAVAGPARLAPLASLADEKAGVTVTALCAAAERCRPRAQESVNGSWLSSINRLVDHHDNKHKRSAEPSNQPQ